MNIPPPPSPELDLQLGLEARLIRASIKPSPYFWGESKSSVLTVSPLAAQRFLMEEIGKMALPILLILVYAIVATLIFGFSYNLIVLAVGSVLSIVAAFIVSIHIIKSLK